MTGQRDGRAVQADGRLQLGRYLARLRREAGYRTQVSFVPLLGGRYVRATIADAESGRRVNRDFWILCDTVLKAGGKLVAAYDQMEVNLAVAALSQAAGRMAPGSAVPHAGNPAADEANGRDGRSATIHRCPNCSFPLVTITLAADVTESDNGTARAGMAGWLRM